MADFADYETDHTRDFEPTYAAPGRMANAVNWAGAVVSLSLVVGMGVWAWQLTTRDVSGVPVIEALESPMRIVPENPGGTQAAHQGLAVNRIAEGAEAEAVPDQVVLAPPPVDLDAVTLESASVPDVTAPLPRDSMNPETQALIDRVLTQGGVLGDTGAPESSAASDVSPQPVESGQVAIIPESVPGVSRSLRPVLRPAGLAERAAAAPAPTPVGPVELDGSSLAVGTRLVQLGAFNSPDLARAEWQRLERQFPDFFSGRVRVIQQASSGGSDFFRLRAHGFENLDASRRFCAALMAQNAACIPVTVR